MIGKKEKLNKRIEELAKQIDDDYKDKEIVAICVLNGQYFSAVHLTLKMKTKMKIEFVKYQAMKEQKAQEK